MDAHRLAEERSLELHRAIAARLATDPDVIAKARERVARWQREGSVHHEYADRWATLLSGPREDLIVVLCDPGEAARALRQVTPFAGAIPPRERWRLWRQVYDRARGEGR